MNPLSILVADDTAIVRDAIERQLKISFPELTVDFAENGEELVNKVRANLGYRLVITDYRMPRLNGVEATRKIREMGYQGWVVLTSTDLNGIGLSEEDKRMFYALLEKVPKEFIPLIEKLYSQ